MARPRTPTSVMLAKGSFGPGAHNPERFQQQGRDKEPTPTGPLGDPPAHLTPFQKAIWHELVSLIPPGVAGNSDRIHVELTVRLIAKLRRGVAKVSESAQLIICLSRLGMTPADRSKVSAIPETAAITQANPEDEFIQ